MGAMGAYILQGLVVEVSALNLLVHICSVGHVVLAVVEVHRVLHHAPLFSVGCPISGGPHTGTAHNIRR